ncbi:MAG: tRNA (adenosine(37)-N6)-dimethylallyltransferase MiaA [Marinilabiliales bacterium]|nr:MAG: tRNA (adenosine(37)-N6)-dimethylallyltransferase MiaA [Marinilabiliales bacterium]
MKSPYNLVTILGPTASSKTGLAAALAYKIDSDVISADSRQVYRGMDLGTGKDYEDYIVNGKQIKYHLIDIVDAGYKYNVFEYQRDFLKVFDSIRGEDKIPVLCGGTGMYIDAVLKGYKLIRVPVNPVLRKELETKSMSELQQVLNTYKKLHNTTDVDTKKRAIRAIEIEAYYVENNVDDSFEYPDIKSLLVGIKFDRESRRKRISERLQRRLESGMIEEVQSLINGGVEPEDLIYYGLEYKYITLHLIGELSYNEMFKKLEVAIHQFAKRQMTWFRGMERKGYSIHWLDGYMSLDEKLESVKKLLFQ